VAEREQQWQQQARRVAFEDYRRQGTCAWIAPRGASMRPLVGTDTWMLVDFGAETFSIGEIILFPLGDILVAHRVVARRWKQDAAVLIAKGDAEPYFDPPIQPADVLGVVRALRQGIEGTAIRLGCVGWTARGIAYISRWSGRGAGFARRLVALLPGPSRRVALVAIPAFVRVTARIMLAPLHWAVWFQTKKVEKWEGGEQHEAVRAPRDPRDLHGGRTG
jgi:hypothetical protein